ncbi:MAG: hypothetical protein HC894_25270 [Microcoleus sp. SM1_3_4]|nr:hypothetical protein [Microcoleus sp. SM1_3_4]
MKVAHPVCTEKFHLVSHPFKEIVMQAFEEQNTTAKTAAQTLETVTDADIVKLKRSDFAIASDYLAAAFSQDQLMAHFLPENEGAKQKTLKQLSQALLSYAQIYNHIYTTADYPKGGRQSLYGSSGGTTRTPHDRDCE